MEGPCGGSAVGQPCTLVFARHGDEGCIGMQIPKQHQPRESVMICGEHFRNDQVITGDLLRSGLAQDVFGIRHAKDRCSLLADGLTE